MSSPPEIAGVSHVFLDVGEVRMHVALAGPADAPTVLLVHGWPQNWWAWRNVIPALGSRFRVIAPDLRGHGWSQATVSASTYRKEQLTSDLLGVLDVLEVERATWVGHDWGAFTGLLAALRAPGRLERLLAIGIPHLWTPPRLRRLVLLAYQGPISLPWLGNRVARPASRAILQAGRGPSRLPAAEVDTFADRIPPHVSVGMYRTFLTQEVLPIARGRYGEITLDVPTTALIGANDIVTSGLAPDSVPGQPNLYVEVLNGVGHWIPEQRPDAVVRWLERGPAGAG